jgi:hypothetical protein
MPQAPPQVAPRIGVTQARDTAQLAAEPTQWSSDSPSARSEDRLQMPAGTLLRNAGFVALGLREAMLCLFIGQTLVDCGEGLLQMREFGLTRPV